MDKFRYCVLVINIDAKAQRLFSKWALIMATFSWGIVYPQSKVDWNSLQMIRVLFQRSSRWNFILISFFQNHYGAH